MVQKLHHSYNWLKTRYVVQGKTIDEMAKEAGVVPMTIRRALNAAGLIRR